jgi:hypothetical protein
LETPSPCPGRVNQCTPSYSRAHHQPPRPPALHPPLTPLSTPPPTSSWPSPYSLSLSLSLPLTIAALFFTPEKGELGGVGDVRLLHYVFLTEPPLTSTLSSSRLFPRPYFFSLSPRFSVLSRCPLPFRVSSLTENESFPLLKSFFFSREPTFLLITRPVGVGGEVGITHTHTQN